MEIADLPNLCGIFHTRATGIPIGTDDRSDRRRMSTVVTSLLAPPPLLRLHRRLDLLQLPQVLQIGRQRLGVPTVGIESLVALLGDDLHPLVADAALAIEHRALVELQQAVHVLSPVVEGKVLALPGPQFGLLQEDDHQPVECVDLLGCEVVLGDDDVLLAHPRTFPGGEGHVGSVRVGAADHDLGGGLAGDGVDQFVLHLGKEVLRRPVVRPVVTAQGEEVAHLLVEALLRGADLTDALKQLVEVVPAAGVLEAFVVHDEALDQIFTQVGSGPLAELGTAGRAHAVTDGQDHLQAVELSPVTLTVSGSCQGFLDN